MLRKIVVPSRLFLFLWYVGFSSLFGSLSCRSLNNNGLQATESRFEFSEVHMGMQVRIVLYAENDARASVAGRTAFATIARLEDIFSDYRPTSELMKLSAQSGNGPIRVSSELFDVMQTALWLARVTEGAFDPSARPLTHLWRVARNQQAMPDSTALAEARNQVGWQWINLDTENQTISLEKKGMMLDLGAIAKGYILDRAMETLETQGIRASLLEAGGEILVSGAPPGQNGWVIGVPGASGTTSERVLTHAAIATSGDTEQFVELDGVRYSHVVDPRTGLGLTHRYQATVIAREAFLADGLATALCLVPTLRSAYLIDFQGLLEHYVINLNEE